MKISCTCGTVIVDQTDYLANKGHLVADEDWEDFVESSRSRGEIDQSFVRHCYQCTSCGKLYVDDHDRRLLTFLPETTALQPALKSIKGALWKAPLIGNWTPAPLAGESKGRLYCKGADGVAEQYDTWEALEQAYFALFFRLKGLGLLRSALLNNGSKQVHVWADTDH
ncbi:hypothetical protein [Burkholderia territorii]|uniref:hypothetical protein n=1 Tax=Burkholderia territorii TaxID=1503055 RepID=UPI00075C464E|nr:hypothetical protein [Burkholderia territorii]KWO50040.1 hypothetical protein WT98_17045 [Burkholderia territorii]